MNETESLQNISHNLTSSTGGFTGHAVVVSLTSLGIILGNLLIIIVSSRGKVFQSTAASRLIIALAVVDLLLGVHYSTSVPNILSQRWTYGSAACSMMAFYGVFAIASEMYLIAGISLERYVAICRPLHYHIILSKRTWTILCLLIGAFLLILTAVPPIAGLQHEVEDGSYFCSYVFTSTFGTIYQLTYGTLVPTLSVSIVMISNVRIVQAIRQQRRSINAHGQHGGQNPLGKIDRGSLISVLLIVILFVTLLPLLMITAYNYTTSDKINILWASVIYMTNSFWNVFVYIGWNKPFRRGLLNLLQCRKSS